MPARQRTQWGPIGIQCPSIPTCPNTDYHFEATHALQPPTGSSTPQTSPSERRNPASSVLVHTPSPSWRAAQCCVWQTTIARPKESLRRPLVPQHAGHGLPFESLWHLLRKPHLRSGKRRPRLPALDGVLFAEPRVAHLQDRQGNQSCLVRTWLQPFAHRRGCCKARATSHPNSQSQSFGRAAYPTRLLSLRIGRGLHLISCMLIGKLDSGPQPPSHPPSIQPNPAIFANKMSNSDICSLYGPAQTPARSRESAGLSNAS
mmetsp:Transcript_98062/g.245675  ORF Transcript_98062/g.245675 Transcript_98062/m.245675 type:complete len:260 (+) Transcript_98062:737-1516(+)